MKRIIQAWQRWDVGGWASRKPLWPLYALLMLALCTVLLRPTHAQNGSSHGITAMWNAPSPVGGSGTIQGYFLFRCIGTATSCTLNGPGWISLGSMFPATIFDGNSCTGFTNCHLDPAAGLSTNTSYMYAVATVDSNGDQSSWDLTTTPAVVGNSFPQNPNAATGAKAVVQ